MFKPVSFSFVFFSTSTKKRRNVVFSTLQPQESEHANFGPSLPWHLLVIYEGWEPNQRATIQKFAHGMKSKRNSSCSGKHRQKVQSAKPFGPKLDYLFFNMVSYFF